MEPADFLSSKGEEPCLVCERSPGAVCTQVCMQVCLFCVCVCTFWIRFCNTSVHLLVYVSIFNHLYWIVNSLGTGEPLIHACSSNICHTAGAQEMILAFSVCARSVVSGSLRPCRTSYPPDSAHWIFQALLFPPPGDFSNPGIIPTFRVSSALAGGFFTTMPPRKPHRYVWVLNFLSTLRILTYAILTTTLQDTFFYSHLTDKDTGAERDEVASLQSHG